MKDRCCGALCGEQEIIYRIYEFRGHLFREYTDGHITPADKDDVDFVKRVRGEV